MFWSLGRKCCFFKVCQDLLKEAGVIAQLLVVFHLLLFFEIFYTILTILIESLVTVLSEDDFFFGMSLTSKVNEKANIRGKICNMLPTTKVDIPI